MDFDSLHGEIKDFNAVFFQNEVNLIDSCISFVEQNDLYVPKENYIIIVDFLETILSDFIKLNPNFMSNTLKKLYSDVLYLRFIYNNLQEYKHKTKKIFDTQFLPSSKIHLNLKKELEAMQASGKNRDLHHKFLKDFEKFTPYYFELFDKLFTEDIKYLLKNISEMLNSKVFYLDELLWIEASKSKTITKNLNILYDANKFNTKDYLLYTYQPLDKSTLKYEYYQSCLRIYK